MKFFRVGKVRRGVVTLYSDSVMGPTERERESERKRKAVLEPIFVLKVIKLLTNLCCWSWKGCTTLSRLAYSSQNLCDENQVALCTPVLRMKVFHSEFTLPSFLCYLLVRDHAAEPCCSKSQCKSTNLCVEKVAGCKLFCNATIHYFEMNIVVNHAL